MPSFVLSCKFYLVRQTFYLMWIEGSATSSPRRLTRSLVFSSIYGGLSCLCMQRGSLLSSILCADGVWYCEAYVLKQAIRFMFPPCCAHGVNGGRQGGRGGRSGGGPVPPVLSGSPDFRISGSMGGARSLVKSPAVECKAQ